MMVAGVGLVVLLLIGYSGSVWRSPPLDRGEIERVKRFADRMRREETWPYE